MATQTRIETSLSDSSITGSSTLDDSTMYIASDTKKIYFSNGGSSIQLQSSNTSLNALDDFSTSTISASLTTFSLAGKPAQYIIATSSTNDTSIIRSITDPTSTFAKVTRVAIVNRTDRPIEFEHNFTGGASPIKCPGEQNYLLGVNCMVYIVYSTNYSEWYIEGVEPSSAAEAASSDPSAASTSAAVSNLNPTPITTTGNIDQLAWSNFEDGSGNRYSGVIFQVTANTNIRGIEAPPSGDGTVIYIYVDLIGGSTNRVRLNHEDGAATAADRMSVVNAANYTVQVGGWCELRYDGTNSRWIPLLSKQ